MPIVSRLHHLALIGELAAEVHVPVLGNHGRVPEGCLLGKHERERVDRKWKLREREHARARERARACKREKARNARHDSCV